MNSQQRQLRFSIKLHCQRQRFGLRSSNSHQPGASWAEQQQSEAGDRDDQETVMWLQRSKARLTQQVQPLQVCIHCLLLNLRGPMTTVKLLLRSSCKQM